MSIQQVFSSSGDARPFGYMAEIWRCYAPFKRELDPHLTHYGQGRGLPPFQVASWSLQPFGHKRHESKIVRLPCPPF